MIKFFIDQHGCAKNQVDGELIIENLTRAGYEQTLEVQNADLIVINSCGFIESAKKESLDAVYSARKEYPNAKILLAGCLAERYGKTFLDALPESDGFIGNGDISLISSAARDVLQGKRFFLKPLQNGVCSSSRSKFLSYKNSAYVKITEGCSNHCSFCAIPLIRGEVRSRKIDDVLNEIKSLLERGIFEINLIGQDLASYDANEKSSLHETKSALARLLQKISTLKGNFWIRLLYIHPDNFNHDILEVLKKDKRILPYFDIPFQSGDDSILQKMNRKKSVEENKKLILDIRRAFPESAIRTTFLLGFPGETEKNAENSLNFLSSIQSDWSGCFIYSKEEGTPASKIKGHVLKKIAKERVHKFEQKQEEITKKNLLRRVGKIYDVLIEEVIPNKEKNEEEQFAIGRAWFQAPEVDGACVVRFEQDDKVALNKIKPGAVIKAKAILVSGVDLDCVFVS